MHFSFFNFITGKFFAAACEEFLNNFNGCRTTVQATKIAIEDCYPHAHMQDTI